MSTVPAVLSPVGMDPRIDEHLSRFLHQHVPPPVALTPDQVMMQTVADLLLRAGKRLRPMLCLWGWRGAGGEDREEAVAAATSLELLQGCALIHDDVMDNSDLRRGGPTVHRELAEAHAARGWRGSSGEFGRAAAVAAGDLCLVWADEMLRTSGLPAEFLTRARPVYDTLRAETIRGQYLDLFFQAEGTLRVEDALRAAQSKTAASTTVGPLRFGGALAGADPELLDAYCDYGRPLGVAFQLRDDLLGAFGDSTSTGKPSGDDLRDGKCTVLLAETRRRADARGKDLIDTLLRQATDAAVDELRGLIEECGARDHVTRMVAALGREALAVLDRPALADNRVRTDLAELARAVTTLDPVTPLDPETTVVPDADPGTEIPLSSADG